MLSRRKACTVHLDPTSVLVLPTIALIAGLKEQGFEAEGEAFEIYLNRPQEVVQEEREKGAVEVVYGRGNRFTRCAIFFLIFS
jgi:hypothetical protein